MQAIVSGGFFTPEFSKEFFKQEKTPFDKLIEDSENSYEQILFNKNKKNLFDQNDGFNLLGNMESYSSKNYKFKHPYDFGDDEYYNRINLDKEEKKTEIIVKKPEKKQMEEPPSLFQMPKR